MARVDVSSRDLARLLDFAALTREVGWSDADLTPLLDGVADLVDCDFVTITVIDPDPARAWCVASPSGHMTSELFEVFATHANDHPYVQYLAETGGTDPARLSDLGSMRTFRRTALFTDHFRPLMRTAAA